MKKILLVLFFMLLICPASVFSQDEVSFKMGLNQSMLSGKHITKEYKWKSGLALGTSFINHFSRIFSLDFEFAYTENGYVYSYKSYKETYLYNYFMFSALYRLYLENLFRMPLENLSVYAMAGPGLAVLIHAKSKANGHDYESLISCNWRTFRCGENELYDFGLIMGAGIGYRLLLGTLYLQMRYNMGFIEFFKNAEQTNKAIAFLLSYSFPLTKYKR